jgi:small subunit ribosomal protein S4e
MVKAHIKRINAPKRWDVLRKTYTFITRPNAGRDFSLCIALNAVLKEMLNKTQTTKESKYLIKNQGVLVNGKLVYDEKFPVGFLDVISFPALGESYRLFVNTKNKLFLLKIKEEEKNLKLSKVSDKKSLSKGLAQINCSDGRNFSLKENDPLLKGISINDSLLYTLPEQKIRQAVKLEKGSIVYLYKGKHIGNVVSVDDFKGGNILFKLNQDPFETKKAYAFVVGKEKPVIAIYEKESLGAHSLSGSGESQDNKDIKDDKEAKAGKGKTK